MTSLLTFLIAGALTAAVMGSLVLVVAQLLDRGRAAVHDQRFGFPYLENAPSRGESSQRVRSLREELRRRTLQSRLPIRWRATTLRI